jgi:hypothetical protein
MFGAVALFAATFAAAAYLLREKGKGRATKLPFTEY